MRGPEYFVKGTFFRLACIEASFYNLEYPHMTNVNI